MFLLNVFIKLLKFLYSVVGKESCLQCRRPQFDSWVGKIPWRRDRLPTPAFLAFPCGSIVKNPPAMWETWVRSGLGRSPGEGKSYPLQHSGLENSMESPWGCKELDTTEWLSLSYFELFPESLIFSSLHFKPLWLIIILLELILRAKLICQSWIFFNYKAIMVCFIYT